jgi:arginine decarboxylase
VLDAARLRSDRLPVFLMLDHGDATSSRWTFSSMTQEVVLVLEDTPAFIAGRIDFAWRRYVETLLPPFFGALVEFANTYEYSMHTPGHAGGAAFRKTPVGKAFYDFYGENLFRTDLSVSVAELGSLLDHSGPVAESERNAARIFGADTTFFVLNGTSTANQIVAHSAIVAGDVVLADRNCHKSLNYALTVTDAIPVYLRRRATATGSSARSRERAGTRAIAESIAAHPLASLAADRAPVYAVVTNSTYDGLCYDAERSHGCSVRACRASTTTKRGSPTPPSTRCTAIATRCTRPSTPTTVRRSTRRSPRTSCSRRSHRLR